MAISLGSAALAFAGGAATQYNKIADEERIAAAKRKERLQELVDQAMVKQEETKYSYEMSEYQKDKALESSFRHTPGGAAGTMGQLAIAERLGYDRTAFLKSGQLGYMEWKGAGDAPIPYTERMMNYAAGDYDPKRVKYAERYRSKNEGKTFTKDGAGILRGVPTKPDGTADPMDIARGVGLDEGQPAWTIAPPIGLEGEEKKKYFADVTRQLQGKEPEHQWFQDKETGAISIGTIDAQGVPSVRTIQEGRPGADFAAASTKGKEVSDLVRLEKLAVDKPEEYGEAYKILKDNISGDASDYSIITGTNVQPDGTSKDYVQLAKKDPEMGLVAVGDAINVGADLEKQSSDARAAKDIQNLVYRTGAAAEMQASIVQRMQTFSASQQGAARMLTHTVDFFTNNLAGLAQLAGVPYETGSDKIRQLYTESGMDMDEVVKGLRESNSYLTNMSDAGLGYMAYTMANVLKDVGDTKATTKYDIEQGADLVNRLSSKEGGIAAGMDLMYRLDVRNAQTHQMVYLDTRANTQQKLNAGKQLVRAVNPDITDRMILQSPQNGKVYIFTSEEHRNKFEQEVKSQGLLNKPVDTIINSFTPQTRPVLLDKYIEKQPNGWLMPSYDDARYLKMFMPTK